MDNKQRIPVSLIEDHHMIREALVDLVNGLDDFEVVMQATNGRDYIDQCANGAAPPIAIVDLSMPVMDGFELMKWIRKEQPGVRPLALTIYNDDETRLKATHAGACGYLCKSATSDVLRTALNSMHHTGHYVTDHQQELVLKNPDGLTPEQRRIKKIRDGLTGRREEALKLACTMKKMNYKRIGKRMKLSERTVQGLFQSMFVLFGVTNQAELIREAIRLKIV